MAPDFADRNQRHYRMTDSPQVSHPAPRRIVAIDCATLPASVAVIGTDGTGCVVVHRDEQRADAWIGPAIEACLDECGAELATIDGFAACVGPGTFTGIRVGTATALGLAAPNGLSVCGVRSLDALALLGADQSSGLIAACIDARRGQVYAAIYKGIGATDGPLLDPDWGPRVCDPQEVLQRISEHQEQPLIIGSGAACLAAADATLEASSDAALDAGNAVSEANNAALEVAVPLAGAIGRLALRGWPNEGDDPPNWPAPHPVYLRPPDARPPRNPLLEARRAQTFEQP